MIAKGTKCEICGAEYTMRFMTQHNNKLCCPLCSHLINLTNGEEE